MEVVKHEPPDAAVLSTHVSELDAYKLEALKHRAERAMEAFKVAAKDYEECWSALCRSYSLDPNKDSVACPGGLISRVK